MTNLRDELVAIRAELQDGLSEYDGREGEGADALTMRYIGMREAIERAMARIDSLLVVKE
jgi:hypothetical protein